jgi:hypothetical protein
MNRSGWPRSELLMRHTVQHGSTATSRTAASSDDRRHTQLAATTAKHPAAQLVRDQEADRVMTEYPDESYDELVRLANLRPPGPGVDKLARNLR